MTTRKNHINRIKARRQTALYALVSRVGMGRIKERYLAAANAEIETLQARIASVTGR